MSSDALLALAAIVATVGCGDCVPAREALRGTRVIGVELTPRAAVPGGVVHVKAIAFDGLGRDVRVSWFRCERPLGGILAAAVAATQRWTEAEIYANCFARGVFARGVDIDLTVDADGGQLDAIPGTAARRWTHLIGAACGGDEVEAPTQVGAWPRCRGGAAFVFLASVPGPTRDGSTALPPPPRLGAITLRSPRGAPRAWGEGEVPVVPRCVTDLCPEVEVDVSVEGAAAGHFANGSRKIVNARDDRAPYLGWFVQASDDSAFTEGCPAIRSDALNDGRVAWRTPRVPGALRFWFWVPDGAGGVVWTTRALRVE